MNRAIAHILLLQPPYTGQALLHFQTSVQELVRRRRFDPISPNRDGGVQGSNPVDFEFSGRTDSLTFNDHQPRKTVQ